MTATDTGRWACRARRDRGGGADSNATSRPPTDATPRSAVPHGVTRLAQSPDSSRPATPRRAWCDSLRQSGSAGGAGIPLADQNQYHRTPGGTNHRPTVRRDGTTEKSLSLAISHLCGESLDAGKSHDGSDCRGGGSPTLSPLELVGGYRPLRKLVTSCAGATPAGW